MRVWKSTLRTLRLISAVTGERMVQVVDRLARAEFERIRDRIPDRRQPPDKQA